MTRREVALRLTLAMIEKEQVHIVEETNGAIGKAVAEIFNEILKTIDVRERDD